MSLISVPPPPNPIGHDLNPYPITALRIVPRSQPLQLRNRRTLLHLTALPTRLVGRDILSHLLFSSLLSLYLRPFPASATLPPPTQLQYLNIQEKDEGEVGKCGDVEEKEKDDAGEVGNLENLDKKIGEDDEELKVAFEKWKSNTYALTVPLRIVALRDSLPAVWLKDFIQCQGRRVRLRPEFRQSLQSIFRELSLPFDKGINPKSAVTADVFTLGDSWLPYAIIKGIIEPMQWVEDEGWFRGLSDRWKVYLRRSCNGNLDPHGKIWAAPYRWGTMVIAYKEGELRKRNLPPLEDWADLWRPELAGRISMVDSPREIIGAVLKTMGASYNTMDIDSQIAGGRTAVKEKLALLVRQVLLFDSQHYLKAFGAGDVWVAVGWSSDILPAAKRMSNVAVIVPKSGASLWADFWAIPAASRLATDQIGGRTRGPSPLVNQWMEFCLQPRRGIQFKEGIIPGSSPSMLDGPPVDVPRTSRNIPKLKTNLIAGVPPAEILAKCEFLEPLSDDALSDYQWLVSTVERPSPHVFHRVWHHILSVVQSLFTAVQSKMA